MSIPQLISSRNDPMGVDLPIVWALIIGFGLMMYVVMDGFDLGIGILLPFVRSIEERHDGEHCGAGLGRERDLARPRRRKSPGGISAGLCGAFERPLHPACADARGPDLARRRVRVPIQGRRRPSSVLG